MYVSYYFYQPDHLLPQRQSSKHRLYLESAFSVGHALPPDEGNLIQS